MAKDFRDFSAAEFQAQLDKHGGERGYARHLGVPRTTIQYWRHAAERGDYRQPASAHDKVEQLKLPRKDQIGYVIISSAQDQTRLNQPFFDNLCRYAKALGAQLLISGFTYNKSLFESHSKQSAEFHPEVVPHLTNHPVQIGHSMRFCGEMNILPTAVDPLSGYDAYTMSNWGIFPHPKIAMKSIPVIQTDAPKVIMTTGSVTVPNFVQKNAGIKAEFHHTCGAVLIPFDHLGNFFSPRHLFADDNGGFYDLDVYVSEDGILFSEQVEAITWGDIHLEKIDERVAALAFGFEVCELNGRVPVGFEPDPLSIMGALKPKVQFVHDLIDFEKRNHHSIDDPVHRFLSSKTTDRVEDAFDIAAEFCERLTWNGSLVNVAYSNHTNEAFQKWLMKADHRNDPTNALFFLSASQMLWQAMEETGGSVDIFNIVMDAKTDNGLVEFMGHDDSYVICPDHGGGIEGGLHGHLGANGSKANQRQFARTGRKSNTAHRHSPGIFEGNWGAGHTCQRCCGYNKGLTSWAFAHIVTYPNGKRAMLFQEPDGAWTPELPSEIVFEE